MAGIIQLGNSGCLNIFKYIQKSWLQSSFLESLASLDSLLYPTENELSGFRNSESNIRKSMAAIGKITTPMNKKMMLREKKDEANGQNEEDIRVICLSMGVVFLSMIVIFLSIGAISCQWASRFCPWALCFCPWASCFGPEVAFCSCPGAAILEPLAACRELKGGSKKTLIPHMRRLA